MNRDASERNKLIAQMVRRSGCHVQDAAACADMTLRLLREHRNDIFRFAVQSGLSYRQIGRIFGMDYSSVFRAVINGQTKAEGIAA